jgi:HAD superfamily phosphatase
MPRELIVFDMDGVLVDVSESYRESIAQTVKHFTGKEVTRAAIQDYKNAGGWNNDWALSHKIIADFGMEVDYDTVVEAFNAIFLGTGNGGGGLITRERWVAAPGALERLAEHFDFAIFTGRTHMEVDLTMQRFVTPYAFHPIIASEDVANGKPAPDGLLHIAAINPARKLWYIGDTVDDARSARSAGVAFIGIAGPENPRRGQLIRLLEAEGAVAVLEDINQLETVLCQ